MLFSICFTSFIIAVLSASTGKQHNQNSNSGIIESTFNGTEYRYIIERASYDDAVSRCNKSGRTLVTIPNKHVQDHLEQNLRRLNCPLQRGDGRSILKLFIGLTDKYENGTWVWSDGTMLKGTGYENWDGNCRVRSKTDNGCTLGLPTRHAVIEACEDDKNGLWYRDPNKTKRYFICQRKINESEELSVNPEDLSANKGTVVSKEKKATKKKSRNATTSAKTSVNSAPVSSSSKNRKQASDRANSDVDSTSHSLIQPSFPNGEAAQKDNSEGSESGNNPKEFKLPAPTPHSSDTGKKMSGSPQSPVLIQPDWSDNELVPQEYENNVNESELSREENGNDPSTEKPLLTMSTWFPSIDNDNAASSTVTTSIRPTASIVSDSDQGNNIPKPESLENIVAKILECMKYRYTKTPQLSDRMLWFCRRNLNMGEGGSLAPQPNMLELWENEISHSVANKMFSSNQDTKIKITSVPGIEVQLIPVSSEDFSRGRMLSEKTTDGRNSVDINPKDLNHIEGRIMMINAILKKEFLDYAGISHLHPLTGLQKISDDQEEHVHENSVYLSQDTVVMSVSVYRHSGKEGDQAEKISVPASLEFDKTADKTSLFVQEKRGRRITKITHQCVFLDNRQNEWSTYGCDTIDDKDGMTTCHCNHTTAFAVMVSMRSIKIPEWEETMIVVLEIFSVIFLALTLAVILWIRSSLRKDRVLTQINLTFSLLCLHVFSLISSPSIFNDRLCEAITVFSHFFLVSSAMWMFNEGLVLYKKSCGDALNFDITKLRRLLFALGWGFPAVYVLLCAGIGLGIERYLDITLGFQNFYHDLEYPTVKKYEICWLSVNSLMVLTAIFPVAFSVICNSFILFRVSRVVWKMSIQTQSMRPSVSDKPRQERGHLKATFKALMLLIPVLGIPWIFAFFVNIPGTETIFVAIHGILNGLQGECIFLIYICLNREVRFKSKRKLMSKSTLATSISNLTPMTRRRKTIPTISKSASHSTNV